MKIKGNGNFELQLMIQYFLGRFMPSHIQVISNLLYVEKLVLIKKTMIHI